MLHAVALQKEKTSSLTNTQFTRSITTATTANTLSSQSEPTQIRSLWTFPSLPSTLCQTSTTLELYQTPGLLSKCYIQSLFGTLKCQIRKLLSLILLISPHCQQQRYKNLNTSNCIQNSRPSTQFKPSCFILSTILTVRYFLELPPDR